MKRTKMTALELSASLIASAFSGIGVQAETEQTTLTFGVFVTDNITMDIWEAIIEPFEEAHPEIDVELVMASGDDRTSFWRTKLNSGEFPDIVVESDKLVTMDIFAEVPEDVQALFNEDLLTEYGGKVVQIPASIQYKGQCYYNKAAFEELGLEEPETWDDFINICETIKEAGLVPLMCGGTGDTWATGGMYWVAEGDTQVQNAYSDFLEGLAEGTYSWNNELIQNILTTYQEMVEAGYYYEGGLSLSYSQCADAFLKGDAVMLIDGSWMNATLDSAENEDFGVFVVPTMDGTDVAIGNASSWAVYKDSKNQDAAWEFIKYVFGEDTTGYRGWLESDGLFSTTVESVTYEMGPVTTKFLENIEGYTIYSELNAIIGDYSFPSGMSSFMEKSFQNIFSGADVSDELDSWDTEYQRLLDAQ
ncbi:MAG: ABC transporter substrate-binding protein [Lachnospiraceae bacterium]|nr:ABC transporter substrate-binding protein [Lachnospiraceae bacterium]